MSSSDEYKLYDYSTLLLKVTTSSFTKAQRRWRIAYASIYSVRVMLSLAKEIISKRGSQHSSVISHLHPYVALDIEPSSSKHWGEIFLSSSFAPKIDQKRLVKTVKEKDLISLRQLGGVESVAAALGTNPENGIRDDDQEVIKRQEMFGTNTYHKPPPKGLLYFVLDAFKDTTILILLVCAALSLGFGIKEHGAEEGWYEGGSIFVAVFLVIVVSALSNFRQETQFDKLSKISNNIKVEVVRGGRRQQISIFALVVGDVVFLKIGDQIPADGLFLDGYSLQVDESSMTGESDHVEVDATMNPFLFSGSKVADGYAQMLVASVGMDTEIGRAHV